MTLSYLCSVNARTRTTALQRLEMCMSDVSHWMAANRLKLNADKTELRWAGSNTILLVGSGPSLRILQIDVLFGFAD